MDSQIPCIPPIFKIGSFVNTDKDLAIGMRGKVYFSTAFGKDGYFVDGFDSDEVLAVDSDKLFGFEYLFETVQTEVEGILIVGLYYNEGDPPDREKELVISCTFMHFRLSPTVTRSLHAGWGRSKSRKKKASII